jgi:steroid delta-isomerase-like uncharacterized protein
MDHVAATDDHKRIVRRVYEEFTNQRQLDLADELFSPDFVDHGAPATRRGAKGVQETTRAFLAAFPDFKFEIEAMVAEGDQVHVRGTITGTQQGAYAGLPASGKHAHWSAMDDFRFENGKIVERWTERNRIALLKQLGALPG